MGKLGVWGNWECDGELTRTDLTLFPAKLPIVGQLDLDCDRSS